MLDELLRLEGLNLSQMQAQFTDLVQHVKAWSSLASRFDEFLTQMSAQTAAVSELARQLAEITARAEPQADEGREIELKEAMDEILNLFTERKRRYYSVIAETLRLDFATVIAACDELARRGLIEGDLNGQARA
jgi:DNA-binding IclR family transcriptional regulator